jgi:hypothetical protein
VEAKDRHVRGVKGRAARDAVSMVAEGTITSAKHMRADLTAHAKRLRANLATHDAEVRAGATPSIYNHEGEVEAARKRLATAEKVLASPKAMAQAERIVEEGVRHGSALVKHDTEAAKAGLFEGGVEQARRARLVVAATEHMGAQHGRDARLTAQAHAARKAQRALQARLNFGHVTGPPPLFHASPVGPDVIGKEGLRAGIPKDAETRGLANATCRLSHPTS